MMDTVIELSESCFICFDETNENFIIKCCNNDNIHKKCLYEIFVHQIDCTQDLKGFFLSFDVKRDIK